MAFFSKAREEGAREEEAGFCDGCHGTVTKTSIRWFSYFDFVSCFGAKHSAHQLRQLGDIAGNPSRLIEREFVIAEPNALIKETA